MTMKIKDVSSQRGQVLAGVVIALVLLMIMIPAIVTWVRQDSKFAVKDSQSTTAFNLAQAGIERGMWELKASTSNWNTAIAGTVIPGFNFDVTYQDIPGGSYRIQFSSMAGTSLTGKEVQVWAEGRDSLNKETRSIKAIFADASLPGPLLAGGDIDDSGAFDPHWGPIMAQGNINISGAAATNYYPRKLAKQVVLGTAGNPRDINGLSSPNTDSKEWWSNYAVPSLPQLDFNTMLATATILTTAGGLTRSSTNYLNGTPAGHNALSMPGYPAASKDPARDHFNCTTTVAPTADHTKHFLDSYHHPFSMLNLTWYWDSSHDVVFTGDNYGNLGIAQNCNTSPYGHRMGLYGTLIIRGNMTVDTEDCYSFTGHVPTNAWQEYTKITSGAGDTAAVNEYPADNGLQKNRSTYNFGSENWTGGGPAAYTDVGFRGFVYVGGNLNITSAGYGDYYGVLWVNGSVLNSNAGNSSLVMYDDTLAVPVLYVTLIRESWLEVSPSSTAWP